MEQNPICDGFEKSFMGVDLSTQLKHCDHYELVSTFRKWLPKHQPILEAGSGSGRWVAWFAQQGWDATGLDWSETLCQRAREAFPGHRFTAGDIRQMPFDDGTFGAVVALGSIEHSPEGPESCLSECRRILRPGGIAVITVPFLGPVRGATRMARIPLRNLRDKLNRRRSPRGLKQAWQGIRSTWHPDFQLNEDGWSFFQYNFSRHQMRRFLEASEFTILEEFVDFYEEGIYHNFGRAAGRYDYEYARVVFSPLGKVLFKWLPLSWCGHMLCYVVQR